MDHLQTIEMFVTVADTGGFAVAARALRVSPPTITRGIFELEARLGVALFHRSTRAVALTDDGSRFLESARQLIADLREAEKVVSGAASEPQGQFYVTAPVVFGRLHVLPVVANMLEQHPDLKVRMMLIDRNVRIVEEGIDVAVRIGRLADSALVAVRIGSVRQMIVASPAYLARNGHPERAHDLLQHQIIGTTGPRAVREWHLGTKRERSINIKPRLLLNTVDSAIAATEAGLGIANLLSYQVDDALRAGRLIELLRPEKPDFLPVSLLFEQARRTLAATGIFIEEMRERAKLQGLSVSGLPPVNAQKV